MRVKVQLIIETEDGISTDEVVLIEKSYSELAGMGLTLEDSHTILSTIQERLITEQTHAYLDAHRDCPDCGRRRRKKGSYPILFRTLFGNIRLQSERLYHCYCQQHHDQKTCSPLMDLLTEQTSPELLYMEAKWSSLAPFGFTAERLKEVLPISRTLNAATVRNHLHRVAKREEATLGEENHVYIDGCPRDWGAASSPGSSDNSGTRRRLCQKLG